MVLRADAQRNLERVLDAATEAFAASGPDVSVHEIAQRAGVGHATVFRRFPTKDALIAAVVERRVRDFNELVDAALAADDPGEAFFEFAWKMAELTAGERGLNECFAQSVAVPGKQHFQQKASRLAARAQRAGALRSDIKPADVGPLIRSALQLAPAKQWRPYLEVVLDGLRPRG
jgi:AcrR family transcriptional regulator